MLSEHVRRLVQQEYAVLLERRGRIAVGLGVAVYLVHSITDWFQFHSLEPIIIRVVTAVLLVAIFGLSYHPRLERFRLFLASTAYVVAFGGFELIIVRQRAFDSVYADAFDQFFIAYCVLIPAPALHAAVVGLLYVAIYNVPEFIYTGHVAEVAFSVASAGSEMVLLITGRHIANTLWERQIVTRINLEETSRQLLQSEKMSALGRVTAGIAHELNNPLAIIGANLVAIERAAQPDGGAAVLQAIARLRIGVERISSVVNRLRQYVSPSRGEMKAADLAEILDLSRNLIEEKLRAKAVAFHGTWKTGLLVDCDPQSLTHVFVNVLDNACDAVQVGGNIWLTAGTADGRVTVTIRDDGPGIPHELRTKIFDPFFTTKEPGAGTGLGLALSKQIIDKHHGRIEVAGETPGARVSVVLAASKSYTVSSA